MWVHVGQLVTHLLHFPLCNHYFQYQSISLFHTNQFVRVCDCYDQDSTVSSLTNGELGNFDKLMTSLLSVEPIINSQMLPSMFRARFDTLLDKLSMFGRAIPFKSVPFITTGDCSSEICSSSY